MMRMHHRFDSFIASAAAAVILFLWSFAEASVWFLASDFLLAAYCLARPARLKRFLPVMIAGSFLGGIAYYVFCLQYPETAQAMLLRTPLAGPEGRAYVADILDTYGVTGVWRQAFSFVPFKVWTNAVAERGLDPVSYFALAMLSRSVRFFCSGLLAVLLRKLMRG